MAGLAVGYPMSEARGGSNPDTSTLYDINGIAKAAPNWLDRLVEFIGEYGIVLGLGVLMLFTWWSVRKREDAPAGVAALCWAPLAAGIALLVNIPIRGFVKRPRPFLDHTGLEVLVKGKTDYSFVSDHATLTMALGVGLFVAHRKYGLIGIGLAFLEGLCRVYMGVHYPTDVIGGLALGTAVALLLAPLAMMLLTPLARRVAGTRAGWLVRSDRAVAPLVAAAGPAGRGLPEQPLHRDSDLAA
ncbi:membrane protein [Streptomyces eurocidicus]|uniref:Membrane protein n=1 Tax=Streptomyces eurocidicus TaxID=66423 RepID=A0A2N8NX39_STREU|nr:phosphatase PAP2 family protein [Streptomyces eurocidicus]MBB5117841.1 undecaprenyl-diphosphatase [Streptomyces eurocidicus]MBF6056379.1 phosphatase PAP2 family protein [Streptomyces eurocidicus]PNE33333.1 membrane protein [Streptomyces eurocidicus]